MKRLTDRTEGLDNEVGRESALALRSVARVREIDRQLYRVRLGRWGARWIVLPGLAVVGFMIAQRVAAVWSEVKLEHVIGGASMLFMAAAGYFVASRDSQQRLTELERERSVLLRRTSGV